MRYGTGGVLLILVTIALWAVIILITVGIMP